MTLNNGMMSSETNEWYTPDYVINFIEKKFGYIELDPSASVYSKMGKRNYTIDDDGLSKSWKVNYDNSIVFVNPPYGRVIQHWVAKSRFEGEQGNKVVMLIPARTDTSYWHEHIFPHAKEIYFIKGRIKFHNLYGEAESAPFPSAFVVFDNHNNKQIITSIEVKKW